MSVLLEQAWQEVLKRPEQEQEAIAAQILETLADEDGWQARFAQKRVILERMAAEAVDEHKRGLTRPLEELLDSFPHKS